MKKSFKKNLDQLKNIALKKSRLSKIKGGDNHTIIIEDMIDF